ncbi:MAG TPA: NAD-binding protein, partial [Hyphomicrobiaceae bacterium]|nr:NAD-binding protein [Hyphomicrobiaceae bacterium]
AARRLGIACSQGGEFAFVLLTAAVAGALVAGPTAELLAVVVTLSMIVTPLALAIDDRFRRTDTAPSRAYDPLPDDASGVVIAGFGRVGQIVSRILRARRIPFTALDSSAEHVDFVREFGSKIYYGDAARPDILRAAQLEKARVFVLAIDDVEQSLRTAEMVRRQYPRLPIIARARNRQHAYRLLDLGIEQVHRETFEAALGISRDVLRGLGLRESELRATVERFKDYDERRLKEDYPLRSDMEKLRMRARNAAEELEQMFREDAASGAATPAALRPAEPNSKSGA